MTVFSVTLQDFEVVMMNYLRRIFAFWVLSMLIFTGAACSKTSETVFTRQQMLSNIAETIITPLHLSFIDQTIKFQEAAYRFRESTSLESLNDVQQEWRSTSYVWE